MANAPAPSSVPLAAVDAAERAAAADPTSAAMWDHLGRVKLAAGQAAEAQAAFERAVALEPTAKRFLLLGRTFVARQDWAAADAALARAHAIDPRNLSILTLWADVAGKRGHQRLAAERLAIARRVDPNDINLLKGWCYLQAQVNLAEVVQVLTAYIDEPGRTFPQQLAALHVLTAHTECLLRQRGNLHQQFASHPDELGIRLAVSEARRWRAKAEEWLRAKPGSEAPVLMYGMATAATKDWAESRRCFEALRSGSPEVRDLAHPYLTFFDILTDASAQPPPQLATPTIVKQWDQDPARVVFVGCDLAYAREYGVPLLRSLAARGDGAVHVAMHLFDGTPNDIAAFAASIDQLALKIAITHEDTGLRPAGSALSEKARGYYHIARFVRFAELLERLPEAAAWIVDADLIFNRAPEKLFHLLSGHDVGLWMQPGRPDVANHVAAGFVGVAPSAAGRDYMQRVANALAGQLHQQKIPWGTDQVVLYAVLSRVLRDAGRALKIAALTPEIYNNAFSPDAMIWPGKCATDSPDYPIYRATMDALRA